jgi:hypothetical protein
LLKNAWLKLGGHESEQTLVLPYFLVNLVNFDVVFAPVVHVHVFFSEVTLETSGGFGGE